MTLEVRGIGNLMFVLSKATNSGFFKPYPLKLFFWKQLANSSLDSAARSDM